MAKIKIKLNSKRSTTIRATDGASYKLRAGENIIELEPKAYSALMSALGLKPNNKKQTDPKSVDEHEQPKEQYETDNKQAVEEPKPIVEQCVEVKAAEPVIDCKEQTINEAAESCEQPVDDVAEELGNDDNNDVLDQFSQMSYSKLKAAYKEITGKNSKLKRNELINFLREHHNAE